MNATTPAPVLVDTEPVSDGAGSVLHIRLNRPERLNAVDLDLLSAVGDALDLASGPSGPSGPSDTAGSGGSGGGSPVRAVVLSGEGRALSAGADLVGVLQGGQEPAAIMAAASRVILGVVDCPVPVVCALTGKSAGFGVSLGLAADVTVMADDASLVFSFLDVGLSADGGISQLLPEVVGRQVASRILLGGEVVDARAASDHGLVAETAPAAEVLDRARRTAVAFAGRPAAAVAGLKRTLVAPVRERLRAALELEAEIQEPLLAGPDLAAAARRFAAR